MFMVEEIVEGEYFPIGCMGFRIQGDSIDLYNINGAIYFGEMTFFHGSGFEHFKPLEWDYKLGDLLLLPE